MAAGIERYIMAAIRMHKNVIYELALIEPMFDSTCYFYMEPKCIQNYTPPNCSVPGMHGFCGSPCDGLSASLHTDALVLSVPLIVPLRFIQAAPSRTSSP